MKQLSGRITSPIKVLNLTPLVRFELTVPTGQKINCLIHQHALNFLALADQNSRIAVYGHPNARHQFVVTKFMVQANSRLVNFSHSA